MSAGQEEAARAAAIRDGIIATAESLGISPVDLATAISYETAGTFDPTKGGPTTQWGQHRGLIQFGEPQAKEYGVDWNDPIGSQLGPDGAVAKYLRKTGVKPGMGMLDIYSAINAGSVGKYNASDANNGGAPGTVRDKVEGQMSGHREKAIALLGGKYQPAQSDYAGGAVTGSYSPPGGKVDPASLKLAWAYRNGMMTPEDKTVYERGVSEGKFKPPPVERPDPLAVYQQTAQRRSMPAQTVSLQAGMVEVPKVNPFFDKQQMPGGLRG
jgi:hypothetical protein